jgi:hypothetical protein
MLTAGYQPGNGWARWNGGNVWLVPDVHAGVAEDVIRRVAGDLHGVGLLHPAGAEVRGCGVARVVEDVATRPGSPPSCMPRPTRRTRCIVDSFDDGGHSD